MTPTQAPRVLLVYPRFPEQTFWNLKETAALVGARAIAPPLGLITVAAMLPDDWSCRLINRNAEELTDADIRGADLVFTGGMLQQEPDTLMVMAMCARLGVPICVGGPGASSTPDVYAHADFLVVGEAEGMIDTLVADWGRGERRGRYDAPKFKADVTKTPIPRFDLLTFDHYLWVNLQFSRGCPFTCEFCDIIELYGRAPRTKTTPQVLAELDRLLALGYRGHVDFVDDNLIGNKKAIKLFLPHLIEWQERHGYPFKFSTEASLNLADDAELLQMLRQANFFAVFVGIETPDEATLVQTSKKQNTRRSISESIHRIYAAGLFVTGGFIVGFDSEERSVAKAMATCIADTGIPVSIIGLLFALPNTQLQRRLKREGRLFEEFAKVSEEMGDQCTIGLNFRTLRPRRDVLADYRQVLAEVYAPENFFARVRRVSLMLDRPRFAGVKHDWRNLLRDGRSLLRVCWRMTVQRPELARHFWSGFVEIARKNPAALESAISNMAIYLHLYPFSRYVIDEIDRLIAELDAGLWVMPPVLAADNDGRVATLPGKRAAKPLTAVA